jgi:hypothetical protein
MGQYYSLACPQHRSYVEGYPLGAGAKGLEHVWGQFIHSALGVLCAAGHGAHPRDLPWLPQGEWAGLSPMMFGDYAKNGDLLGFEPYKGYEEDQTYRRCGGDARPLGGKKAARKSYIELSNALVPIMERIADFRAGDLDQAGNAFGDSGWRTYVPVEHSDAGWNILSQSSADAAGADLEYYKRMTGRKGEFYNRPPVDIDPTMHFTPRAEVPESVPPARDGQGAQVLWVNIDSQEFIDPAICGDVPDMAGTLMGKSSRAIVAMIMHPCVRGGGELADAGPLSIAGRWRGDRIVLLGPNGFKARGIPAIDPETVKNSYTDISGNIAAFMRADDHFGNNHFEIVGELKSTLTPTQSSALTAALKAPALRNHLLANEPGFYDAISVEIQPAMTLSGANHLETPIETPYSLAPRLTLLFDDGVVWLPPAIRQEVARFLAQDDIREEVIVNVGKTERWGRKLNIDVSALTRISLAGMSAHQRLPLVG